MAKKAKSAKDKRTVSIDLDVLRKAVEERAPGYRHILIMESMIRSGDTLGKGVEERLVSTMAVNMHTVLGLDEVCMIKDVLIRVAGLMGLLEAVAAGGTLDNVSPHDLRALAWEAYEELYRAKATLEMAHTQKGKEA